MKRETTATIRNLRMAPRKVRLLIDLVRGMHVDTALTQLTFSKKEAAKPVLKLLKSAIANATHNHQIDPKTLVITRAFVDGGLTLHRYTPRAFGRAAPIRKRSAHVTLVLSGDGAVETAAKTEDVVVAEPVAETPKKKDVKKKSTAKKVVAKKK